MAPIQIKFTDVEKCFNKMWLQATINDLYEVGIINTHLTFYTWKDSPCERCSDARIIMGEHQVYNHNGQD